MKNTFKKLVLVWFLIGCSSVALLFAEDERSAGGIPGNTARAVGDPVFQLNVSAATGSAVCLGMEFAQGFFWVTAAGITVSAEPENFLYKLDASGNLLQTFVQPTTSRFGWRDLAFDGAFLYGSDSAVIDQIDPSNGQKTGVSIPSPVNPARGIAYDPATDHFWVVNWSSDIFEIDRSGNVIRSFPNTHQVYGLAWDRESMGWPYLWLWHQDDLADANRISALNGMDTGVTFRGITRGAAGGATVTSRLLQGRLAFVGLEQLGNTDMLVAYDLDTVVVPTLSQAAFLMFAVLLMGTGLVMNRRRKSLTL